jgi:hypothetical protein
MRRFSSRSFALSGNHSRYSPEISFLQRDFLEDQANSLLQSATASSESIREPTCSPTWTRYCVAHNAAYGGAPVYLLFSTFTRHVTRALLKLAFIFMERGNIITRILRANGRRAARRFILFPAVLMKQDGREL